MSNLYKSNFIKEKNEEKRIIDSNEEIHNKILKIRTEIENAKFDSKKKKNSRPTGFVEGIDATEVEILLDDQDEILDEERSNVVHMNEEDILESKAQAKLEADKIIELANEEYENIIESAKIEAQNNAKIAYENAVHEGYEEGKIKAKNEYDSLIKKLAEKEKELEFEFAKKSEEIEPILVETLLEVFSKITNVLAKDKKEIILFLVNNVMSKNEISKDIMIRVSKDDYPYLKDNKQKIIGSTSKELHIEIIEDSLMKKNDCIIETEQGIFDCSLDIQLEKLIEDIKILSVGMS